ncbi:MAG: hypothetical protein PQ275_09050 [Elizabethkingia anophelis]|nr:MAG: hypothetical protein PQ275_09050 [Elizabethkingia anophelis]
MTNTKHLITCRQLVLLNIVYQTKHKVTILIQPEIIHIWGMYWILKLSLWDRMKSRITNPRHRVAQNYIQEKINDAKEKINSK